MPPAAAVHGITIRYKHSHNTTHRAQRAVRALASHGVETDMNESAQGFGYRCRLRVPDKSV